MTVEHVDGVIAREAELQAVGHFVDAMDTGPAALVIRGEPGIGKTTIWHAAVARARAASYGVLSARPGSSEADLPYVGLSDLVAQVPEDLVRSLPSPLRRALDVALLRVDAGGSPLQQRAVSSAALQVITNLARAAPVVLAIDDLQWLDAPSVRVLRFAVRRIGPARVGILVASRPHGTDDDPLNLSDTLAPERLSRLTIGPLELPALDRLLRSHLHTDFLGPTLRRIHETSGGNPFFAIELGRALLDPYTYAVPGQPFPAPSSLPELVAARLARVSRPARQALLAAAALARPTVDLVLAATASEGVDMGAITQAAGTGVVTVRGGDIRFTHPLLSSVLYAEASWDERRGLHRRLASLVADPEERAHHLGLSAEAPDGEIALALDDAARRAASRGAPDAAALLLEQAADLTPMSSAGDRVRRRLDAADQHVAAGDTARGRHLLHAVSSSSDPGVGRARALHRLGHIAILEGDLLAVPPLLQEALGEVGDDLALRASIERDLVWSLATGGAVAEAVPHARAGLEAAEAAGQPILVAEALAHLCMATVIAGRRLEPELLHRAIAMNQEVGIAPPPQHPGIATGGLSLAMTLKWADDFDRARSLLESLRGRYVERGDEGALAPVLFHLGELECWAGNWPQAARIAEASHELASHAGQALAERRALLLDATVASYQGDAEATRTTGAQALALAEKAGDAPAVIRSLRALGLLELSLGDAGRALDYLERGVRLEAAAGYDPATVRIVPDAIEAFLVADRVDDAAKLVDDLEASGARSDRPWPLITGARCRGLLEAASGRFGEAQSALERAVKEHDRLGQPFERARTLLALGGIHRRAKQKRAAREALEEAMSLFDGLGARSWASRTRAELGRIAGRTTSHLALTATEEQVAGLVAEGRTNREVAAALFMSVKTVETNLTHIYRKLGVATRRDLAARLRSAPGT